MTTFRISKSRNFTTVDNTHINDDRLSWKATAILTYLLSKPDNWIVHIKQLATAKKCGIKAVYAGMKELKALGYIEHEFIQASDGKFIKGQYIVHEIPIEVVQHPEIIKSEPYAQNGDTVNSNTEKRFTENRPLLITDRIPLVKTDFSKKRTTTKPETSAAVAVNKEIPKAEKKDTDSKLELDLLVKMIPTKHQTPLVIKFIEQKLSDGINVEELKACIIYVKDKAKGNGSQFKSYLGKCLDNKWASGVLEEFEAERLRKEEQEAQDAMKAFLIAQERRAKLDAEEEERAKAKAEDDEIKAVLETVDIADLDSWIESHHLESRNSCEQGKWKRKERYITRRLLVKEYLQHKLLAN